MTTQAETLAKLNYYTGFEQARKDAVETDQNWDAGTTTFVFEDGSKLIADDTSLRAVAE